MQTNWILDQGFWGLRFYDLPNLLICLIFILYLSKSLKVRKDYTLVLILHCFLPMFLSGVLFPYDYMADSLAYWRDFEEIRSGDQTMLVAWFGGDNVAQASTLFALMPLPFALTPLSLGFFNTFLYASLFFWLFKKNVLTPVSAWFYLLYPSLALYSGMGLRDTFILVFMIIAIQFAREGRWLIMLAPLGLLYAIKFQNFFILAPALIVFVLFGIRGAGISFGSGILTLFLSVTALILLSPTLLPLVNLFRLAMYHEDGGFGSLMLIETPVAFLMEGMSSGLYFLLKPFPWEATNLLQVIQSVENIMVILIIFLISRAAWHRFPRRLAFWILFMIFALSVYGLVVFNYGTAARYRYPFIVIYVIFVSADCQVHRLFKSVKRQIKAGGSGVPRLIGRFNT